MRSLEFLSVTGLMIFVIAVFAIWAFFKILENGTEETTEIVIPGKIF